MEKYEHSTQNATMLFRSSLHDMSAHNNEVNKKKFSKKITIYFVSTFINSNMHIMPLCV